MSNPPCHMATVEQEARLAGHISDRSCEQMVMFQAQLHSQHSHMPSLHHTPNERKIGKQEHHKQGSTIRVSFFQ